MTKHLGTKSHPAKTFTSGLILFFVLSVLSEGKGASPGATPSLHNPTKCELDMEYLYAEETDILTASNEFWDLYVDKCDTYAVTGDRSGHSACVLAKGTEERRKKINLSYAPLEESKKYDAIVYECEALGSGYRICHVDTEIELDSMSVDANTQPLCLPPSCKSSDMNDREWTIALNIQGNVYCKGKKELCKFESIQNGQCNPSVRKGPTDADEILSFNARYDSGCERDLKDMDKNIDGTYSAFFTSLSALKELVDNLCMSGEDNACSSTFERDGSVSLVTDFKQIANTKEFSDYNHACQSARGTMCTVSLTFDVKGPDVGLSVEMNDLPVCFASSCIRVDEAYGFFEDVAYDAMTFIGATRHLSRNLSSFRRGLRHGHSRHSQAGLLIRKLRGGRVKQDKDVRVWGEEEEGALPLESTKDISDDLEYEQYLDAFDYAFDDEDIEKDQENEYFEDVEYYEGPVGLVDLYYEDGPFADEQEEVDDADVHLEELCTGETFDNYGFTCNLTFGDIKCLN